MSAIAGREMRAEPRLAIPGRDPVRREQRDEILIKLANGGDAPGRDELRPGIAADDAAEGDGGGGGPAGFEGLCDALPQEGMRSRRLVDRAEGEMVMLWLQPREQIARNGRQQAAEIGRAAGGDKKWRT